MNPYQQPQSKPELLLETQTGNRWLVLVQAILIASLLRSIAFGLSFTLDDCGPTQNVIINLSLFLAPCIVGALFLAAQINKKWVASGLIYSAAIAFVDETLEVASFRYYSAHIVIENLIVMLLLTSFTTMLTIAITRLALRFMPSL